MVWWFLIASPFMMLQCLLRSDYWIIEKKILRKTKYLILILCLICSSFLHFVTQSKQNSRLTFGNTSPCKQTLLFTQWTKWMNSNKTSRGPDGMYCLLNNRMTWDKISTFSCKNNIIPASSLPAIKDNPPLTYDVTYTVELPPGPFPAAPSVVWAPQSLCLGWELQLILLTD